ncbi:MAG TPA: hypothetical protein VF670_04070, partial [Duganella sp.]
MQDLNSLIDPASGWTIPEAWDINNRGQIVAFGCRTEGCTTLLLTPAGGAAEPAMEQPAASQPGAD